MFIKQILCSLLYVSHNMLLTFCDLPYVTQYLSNITIDIQQALDYPCADYQVCGLSVPTISTLLLTEKS